MFAFDRVIRKVHKLKFQIQESEEPLQQRVHTSLWLPPLSMLTARRALRGLLAARSVFASLKSGTYRTVPLLPAHVFVLSWANHRAWYRYQHVSANSAVDNNKHILLYILLF